MTVFELNSKCAREFGSETQKLIGLLWFDLLTNDRAVDGSFVHHCVHKLADLYNSDRNSGRSVV